MDWVQSMHRSVATAIPEDILVFFTQHWLPNHAGSSMPSGRLIAVPTSLAGAKSHLAKDFDLQGRVEDWTLQHSSDTGNSDMPVYSTNGQHESANLPPAQSQIVFLIV